MTIGHSSRHQMLLNTTQTHHIGYLSDFIGLQPSHVTWNGSSLKQFSCGHWMTHSVSVTADLCKLMFIHDCSPETSLDFDLSDIIQ
jgi:hypothetical protein